MESPRSERLPVSNHETIDGFVDVLEELTNASVTLEDDGATYEIESDRFSLTFVIDDAQFVIRNIDVRGNHGLGRKIIEAIHHYADENQLEVVAQNVLNNARGFWEEVGYRPATDGDSNEYFRPS